MWHVLVATLGVMAARAFAAEDNKYDIEIGYLPCIEGEQSDRQGPAVSGALSVALEEINQDVDLLPNVRLSLVWNDTRCDAATATRLLSEMTRTGVVAIFGPEGRCYTDGIVAESRNLPVISYKCSDYPTSALSNFARLEPSGVRAAKPVISLLRYYRWFKFSILYERPWETAALALERHAEKNNMTVNHRRLVDESWHRLIQETKGRTRIYVFLGSTASLVDMMSAMESLQLFARGEYMVIFVNTMAYSAKDSLKYLVKTVDERGKQVCPETNANFEKRARSLFAVVSSQPDASYVTFARRVRRYNAKKPFEFPEPTDVEDRTDESISIYAAYLYDSVKLYATALHDLIEEEMTFKNETLDRAKLMSVATDGSRIVSKMIASTPFKSIAGTSFSLDERANSEGDFSVLVFKNIAVEDNCNASMYPVGHFRQRQGKEYPEYKLSYSVPIDWPDGVRPDDEPACGFFNLKLRYPAL